MGVRCLQWREAASLPTGNQQEKPMKQLFNYQGRGVSSHRNG